MVPHRDHDVGSCLLLRGFGLPESTSPTMLGDIGNTRVRVASERNPQHPSFNGRGFGAVDPKPKTLNPKPNSRCTCRHSLHACTYGPTNMQPYLCMLKTIYTHESSYKCIGICLHIYVHLCIYMYIHAGIYIYICCTLYM